MDSNAVWPLAWKLALPLWSDWLRHSGWRPMLMAMALATASLACAAAWRACRDAAEPPYVWLLAAGVLAILALNTLLALDLLAGQLLRNVAQQQGWYAARREIQWLTLATLGGLFLQAGVSLRQPARHPAPGLCWLRLGLGLLVTIAVLRAVSLHATDLVIGARVAGLSLGRLFEVAGIGAIAAGIGMALRAGQA